MNQVDIVTPMCSQLTYEGLIDEFLQINNGAVELDPIIMGAQQGTTKKVKVPLNSRCVQSLGTPMHSASLVL
jgi:hypothetical protein